MKPGSVQWLRQQAADQRAIATKHGACDRCDITRDALEAAAQFERAAQALEHAERTGT